MFFSLKLTSKFKYYSFVKLTNILAMSFSDLFNIFPTVIDIISVILLLNKLAKLICFNLISFINYKISIIITLEILISFK